MRRFRTSYLIAIILISILLILTSWVITPVFQKKMYLTSPLPLFLNLNKNSQVTTLNLWLPSIKAIKVIKDIKENKIKKPEILAKAVLVYDLTTGETLYSKNPKERLPMASLTKIMTAIIALENKKGDNRYLVSKKALVGENSMGLSEGEVLSLEELLYGLMLTSGNDAAEVLAENFPGGRGEFIRAMNNKAKSLGLRDTVFSNPSGLEGDGEQYSTAYDLLVISKYVLDNFPLFNKVVSTFDYNIPQTSTHKAFYLENETNLLTSYPGVKGIKTGFTPKAGLCLMTYLEYGGHRIIGVILGSNNRREEMKELLDYSLKIQGITSPPHG